MSTQTDDLLAYTRAHTLANQAPPVPSRHVALVTCMDTRIDPFRIFGLDAGQVHIFRNAGGIVTDDVLRSLVISQRLLQTREIVLMHHTRCGLNGLDEPGLREALTVETGRQPPYAFGAFDDLDEAVRRAVQHVREHPFLPHRDRVRGCIYDVESGIVREVDA